MSIQVVDASVVVAALVDDSPDGRWSEEQLLGGELAAPHLLLFEVANVLRRLALHGTISEHEAVVALDDLDRLAIQLVPFGAIADRVWQLRATLTAYDGAYVATAELLACPLATLDTRWTRAPGHDVPVATPRNSP